MTSPNPMALEAKALEAATRLTREQTFSALTIDEHKILIFDAVAAYVAALPPPAAGEGLEPAAGPSLADVLKIWRKLGGTTHGPNVEHVSMKLADFRAFCLAIIEQFAATPAARAAVLEPYAPTHCHKKRGTLYELIGIGKVQTETWQEPVPFTMLGLVDKVDMREVAIYRSVDDGSLWVRPREEFEDGRFEALTAEKT